MELVCGIDEAVEEVVARVALFHLRLEQFLQRVATDFGGRGREDDALALLDLHFEVAGHVEVLVGSIATLLLLGIFDAPVPIGTEDELVLLAELHVEVGIAGVHARLDAIVDGRVVAAGRVVLVCERPHASESQEGLEAQCRSRVGVVECVADKDAVLVMLEHHFLSENDAANAVDGGRHLVAVELADVLVPLGAVVVALILVEAEVEFSSMLYDCHVERRQQHMVLVIQFWDGNHEQAVVLARVAVDNGRA